MLSTCNDHHSRCEKSRTMLSRENGVANKCFFWKFPQPVFRERNSKSVLLLGTAMLLLEVFQEPPIAFKSRSDLLALLGGQIGALRDGLPHLLFRCPLLLF